MDSQEIFNRLLQYRSESVRGDATLDEYFDTILSSVARVLGLSDEEFKIGNWRLTQQGGAVVVEGNGGSFTIPGDQVADLIVGLLVINPGANPELIASNEMARHFDVIPKTILNWFKAGLVPGAMLAPYQGPGGTVYKRYLMPRAALDEVKRPTRGNPNFGRQE